MDLLKRHPDRRFNWCLFLSDIHRPVKSCCHFKDIGCPEAHIHHDLPAHAQHSSLGRGQASALGRWSWKPRCFPRLQPPEAERSARAANGAQQPLLALEGTRATAARWNELSKGKAHRFPPQERLGLWPAWHSAHTGPRGQAFLSLLQLSALPLCPELCHSTENFSTSRTGAESKSQYVGCSIARNGVLGALWKLGFVRKKLRSRSATTGICISSSTSAHKGNVFTPFTD